MRELYYASSSSSSSSSTNVNLVSFSNANLSEKERDECIRRLRKLARAVSGVAREDQRERGRQHQQGEGGGARERVRGGGEGRVGALRVRIPFFLLLVCLIEYVRTGS